jgi:hypothetical protein
MHFRSLLLLLLITGSLSARSIRDKRPLFDSTSFKESFALEAGVWKGFISGQHMRYGLTFRAGYQNWFFTARCSRSAGRRNLFENSWMLGHRWTLKERYNFTASVGFADLAVARERFTPYNDVIPAHYKKFYGGIAEFEAEVRLVSQGKLTPVGLTASTFVILSGWDYRSGVAIGIKLSPFPHRGFPAVQHAGEIRREKMERRSAEQKRRKQGEIAMPVRNIIRTKLLPGILVGTHVEYERNVNGRFGYTVGIGARYIHELYAGFFQDFLGPDAMLRGGEVSLGGNYYVPKEKGWWSFGARTGFRHRENSGFYAYYYGQWRRMSRSSEDIMMQARASFTWTTKSPVNFELYLASGARVSYIETRYTQYVSTPAFQGNVLRVEKGWRMLPALSLGVNIGVGW